MIIDVEEGYMRGVFVDKQGNEYIYYGDTDTIENAFYDLNGNVYIEAERNANDIVTKLKKV